MSYIELASTNGVMFVQKIYIYSEFVLKLMNIRLQSVQHFDFLQKCDQFGFIYCIYMQLTTVTVTVTLYFCNTFSLDFMKTNVDQV